MDLSMKKRRKNEPFIVMNIPESVTKLAGKSLFR